MQTTSAADIEAVLDESGPDYEDFSYEPATGGTRADVYMVTLVYRGTEYEVYVKFKPAGEERFAVEPTLHDYVADRTEIPIPGSWCSRRTPSGRSRRTSSPNGSAATTSPTSTAR
ncbi:hypothetical protein ACFQL4_14965 [Halosimplex aquaticum]